MGSPVATLDITLSGLEKIKYKISHRFALACITTVKSFKIPVALLVNINSCPIKS